jgi:protein TonB
MLLNLILNIMINISSDLYKTSWTEIIFKNRNKAYGAYQLRAESSSITIRSLLIVAPVFILLMAGPGIYRRFNPELSITDVSMRPPDEIPVLPPVAKAPEKKMDLPKADPSQEKLKTVKIPSHITVVEQPQIDEVPPAIKDLEDAVAGQLTSQGAATHESASPETGTGRGSVTVPAEDNTVYETSALEQYPEFEGGMAAWAKFIQRNLRYPEDAQEKGIQGKVFVSFVVEKDGSVSGVSLIRGIGSGCDEEAMRVIKKSPRWKPGLQHNNPVRVRYTMPLSFTISQ